MLKAVSQPQQVPVVPSAGELNAPFSNRDLTAFKNPPKVYYPETWFHFIGGNVGRAGITADLEAIAGAGLSGIHLFHGQFGGPWPGVSPQITCLSKSWDDVVRFTAEECRRLGLRFSMQNCPGWAMSGGPWIEPSNAMRNLVWSRVDVSGSQINEVLPLPQPSVEEWRDYNDITVLAFPTPLDDTGENLKPLSVKSDTPLPWKDFISGANKDALRLEPSMEENPHRLEVTFANPVVLRTVEFSDVQGFNHAWCYTPGVKVKVTAVLPHGATQEVLNTPIPMASWQSSHPISLACDETQGTGIYRIEIVNKHDMNLRSFRLFSAARKNNWESEAAWTLRSIVRHSEHPQQSTGAFINPESVLDISAFMDKSGDLNWQAPEGEWTILRIGHVNAGRKNAPAPPEGTGWECDKLSESGPKAHFAGYIGRLNNGPLKGGLLNGMLLDSWECYTQTWTNEMEPEFKNITGYELKKWLPAVLGYVISDQETTSRFLRDWRGVIGDLFANRFYGSMSKLARENGLNIIYETAGGDVFPADIMEYFKYADVPMCEFWHPYSDSFVGSINFKPIKPTASAARLYGKPRVSAEAFTSFDLNWDEHLSMLKEVANHNFVEGVTHLVFHTYTHNPRTDWLPPGTSFGSGIGTPFLRGQTWWKHMPEFTSYLSRLNYLFERGKPISDVLWYLGDEINHKPDQEAPFPKGFKYDYCNPDVLLNRLSVRDGKIVTPEGISYRVMWLPDNERMLPETLEKILLLVREGATVIGNAPQGLATLKGGKNAQQRFEAAVKELWGNSGENIRIIGKGKVLAGFTIDGAIAQLSLAPDVTGGDALWLHRQTEGADWYYICAPYGRGFQGELSFNNMGNPAIWNPVSGETEPAKVVGCDEGRTSIRFDLARAGSCFVVFRKALGKVPVQPAPSEKRTETLRLSAPWKLSFPASWGASTSVKTTELKPWKDLEMSAEGKAFSGTVTYTTSFDAGELKKDGNYSLDLGRVEMIAVVTLNGKKLRTLWTPPYCLDITDVLKPGKNSLQVEVTSTWFNRLVYDAGQPEEQRKTWVISGPSKDEALRESGLLGPVVIRHYSK
ncbi:hypothetical protein D1164_01270 [Mariniphaga sediminis]|uniref:Beta-mannosidase-like galactose-binding domain-containing protein n=2 Tax=Mariniphaga sediminis TaxID=1628158 RepID=A0A399DB86_9BACT|nr:hypothetical protein D1164_01270 [Mariniphaga sediminis]